MHARLCVPIYLLLAVLAGLFAIPPSGVARAQDGAPLAIVLTADGPLTTAMAGYLERGIRTAEQRQAEVLVFQLNTPGGELGLMNRMTQDILASQVPVVVYVAPRGAIAGSAGTILTLAGHAAAMAPETAIGAASPVGGAGEDLGETLEAKQKNIMKATARSLAAGRGEQAMRIAEATIESAEAVSANEALQAGVVDFISNDLNELLSDLDGFQVTVNNQERSLNTANAAVDEIPPTFVERLLGALTDPNLIVLLINLGIAAVLIEISSPGGWVAGFIGVISLALGTYGLGLLPFNAFGIVFLVLAFALFILDIKAPTHGALTAAGVGSLIAGALILFNTPAVPGFQRVSVPLVISTSIFTGGVFFLILLFALRAQKIPVRTGQESLLGGVGTARTGIAPRGIVQLEGERWTAELAPGEEPMPAGARVQVVRVDGLRLIVRRAN